MYINAGYLNNSRLDFKDYSAPLIVGSCGTYRLKTRKRLPTYWQKGRRDYQILYVANGKAHFWFDGVEQVVSAGNMVLYKPDEIQKYVYYLEDHPEVFWIHFTGATTVCGPCVVTNDQFRLLMIVSTNLTGIPWCSSWCS